jgi:hypothetical protein
VLRLFTPVRLAVAGLLVAAVVAVAWVYPTDSYIFLPNNAHPVAPLVKVEGGHNPRGPGGIYFVDVLVRKATVLERIWSGSTEGATLVPAQDVRPPGVSEGERRREELAEMKRSQSVAAAVALRELGYKVIAKPIGDRAGRARRRQARARRCRRRRRRQTRDGAFRLAPRDPGSGGRQGREHARPSRHEHRDGRSASHSRS